MLNETRRQYMRRWTKKFRNERRKAALAKLGGKCVKCGATKRLEFDHIDRNTKVERIAKLWTASEAKFWAEVDKCQLLCYHDHKIKTISEERLDNGQVH